MTNTVPTGESKSEKFKQKIEALRQEHIEKIAAAHSRSRKPSNVSNSQILAYAEAPVPDASREKLEEADTTKEKLDADPKASRFATTSILDDDDGLGETLDPESIACLEKYGKRIAKSFEPMNKKLDDLKQASDTNTKDIKSSIDSAKMDIQRQNQITTASTNIQLGQLGSKIDGIRQLFDERRDSNLTMILEMFRKQTGRENATVDDVLQYLEKEIGTPNPSGNVTMDESIASENHECDENSVTVAPAQVVSGAVGTQLNSMGVPSEENRTSDELNESAIVASVTLSDNVPTIITTERSESPTKRTERSEPPTERTERSEPLNGASATQPEATSANPWPIRVATTRPRLGNDVSTKMSSEEGAELSKHMSAPSERVPNKNLLTLSSTTIAPTPGENAPIASDAKGLSSQMVLDTVQQIEDTKPKRAVTTRQIVPSLPKLKTAVFKKTLEELERELTNNKYSGEYNVVLERLVACLALFQAAPDEEELTALLVKAGVCPGRAIPSGKLRMPSLDRLLVIRTAKACKGVLELKQTLALPHALQSIALLTARIGTHQSGAINAFVPTIFSALIGMQGRTNSIVRTKGYATTSILIQLQHIKFEHIHRKLVLVFNDKKKSSEAKRTACVTLLHKALPKAGKLDSIDGLIKIGDACIQALDKDASQVVKAEAMHLLTAIREDHPHTFDVILNQNEEKIVRDSKIMGKICEIEPDWELNNAAHRQTIERNGQKSRPLPHQMANRQPNIPTKKHLPPARRNAKMTGEKENSELPNVARKSKGEARKCSAFGSNRS